MTGAPFVYGAYTQWELDAEYDTALTAREDVPSYLERFAELGRAARAEAPPRTLAYGEHPRERMDLFAAPQPDAPLFLWIHGGYWRRLSKDDASLVAPPLVRAGVAVAVPSYPLAPEASLTDIVASIHRAYAVALTHAASLNANPERVFVGGHSVGAQLAGMLAASFAPRGTFALSGVYELEPVRLSAINATIAMDVEQARRYSPLGHVRERPGTLAIATGACESDEFQRQHRAYARAWRDAGGAVREVAAPGHDHFSVVLELANERSALARALRELVTSG